LLTEQVVGWTIHYGWILLKAGSERERCIVSFCGRAVAETFGVVPRQNDVESVILNLNKSTPSHVRCHATRPSKPPLYPDPDRWHPLLTRLDNHPPGTKRHPRDRGQLQHTLTLCKVLAGTHASHYATHSSRRGLICNR
jgi:hypothetical protein